MYLPGNAIYMVALKISYLLLLRQSMLWNWLRKEFVVMQVDPGMVTSKLT